MVEDANKFLVLSEEGRHLAEVVERNDELLEVFFREVLGLNPDQAEVDACKIEHLLSLEASVKLCHFIECIRSDQKPARDFLKLLRSKDVPCTTDKNACPHCQNACVYDVPVMRRKRTTA